MDKKIKKDIIYFVIFIHITTFLFSYFSLKSFNGAINETISQSIAIIIGSLLAAYIEYIRRKIKKDGTKGNKNK